MRLNLSHTFDCDAETLWRITDSEEFEQRLAEASDTTRELIESRDENGVQIRVRRITAKRELPAPMRKALGSDAIRYDQETRRKEGENTLRWTIIPMVLKDRLSAEGVTRIDQVGEGRSSRTIEGEVNVRVPLVGKRMEQRLADEVASGYSRAADIIRDMLAREK